MRKLIRVMIVAALAAVIAPAAAAAKPIPYEGKTTGGHDVTIEVVGKKTMKNFIAGVPMQCISIQGGGDPISGVEVWNFGRVDLGLRDYEFSEVSKPSLHYNEVTRNHKVTTRREARGAISGSIRVQYSFLIPKFPIGTFSVYSCLGTTDFSATPTESPEPKAKAKGNKKGKKKKVGKPAGRRA